MKFKLQNLILILLKLLLFGVIVYLLVAYFKNNISRINSFPRINWYFLVLSISILFIIQIIIVFIWQYFFKLYNQNLTFTESFYSFYYPVLAKYLPGKAWHQVGKVLVLNQLEVRKSKSITITFFEQVLIIYSGLLISIPYLLTTTNWLVIIPLFITSTGGIFLMLSRQENFLKRINHLIRRFRIHRQFQYISNLPPSRILTLIILYLVYWFGAGIFFHFCIRTVDFDNSVSLSISIGVYAGSWIMGFIAPIAPAGLGVRESAMLILMKNYIDATTLLIVIIGVRLLTALSEILFFFFALYLKKFIRLQEPDDSVA